ncbi:MAG: hypothetical protein U9Q33_08055 [Campylobacterota bacterium]|nr:hypothetical protein [Campylobacterota bacterium]
MTNLSKVFKYISHFRHAGHQVGRKVGDMLEVLTYAAIIRNDALYARLQVEPKIFGYSEAGHKVEFAINEECNYDDDNLPCPINGGNLENVNGLKGFIECKKVGVEQTINSSFKKNFEKIADKKYKINHNTDLLISFQPRGVDIKHKYNISINSNNILTIIKENSPDFLFTENLENGSRIIFTLGVNNQSHVLHNDQSLRDIDYELKNCRILEINELGTDHVIGLLNDCLPGPQTPEKAKQSSFVALDVRKRRFGQFDMRENEQDCISVLVLTEFSHWEQKSQNMVTSCIDKNFVVDDDLIINAFERFEEAFGEDFYSMITKENFENNITVRSIALDIVNEVEGKIFKDMDDEQYKELSYNIENNFLCFIS